MVKIGFSQHQTMGSSYQNNSNLSATPVSVTAAGGVPGQ